MRTAVDVKGVFETVDSSDLALTSLVRATNNGDFILFPNSVFANVYARSGIAYVFSDGDATTGQQ